jgi:type VI secretion system protein ImpA
MSSPPVLDFDTLLADIPGESPVGPNLRAQSDSLFHQVRDLRNKASNAERSTRGVDLEGREPDPPEWGPVLERSQKALTESKDLEMASYLTEALVRLHGFAGLRDGFRLTRELVEKYWEIKRGDQTLPGLYPHPDPEESPEERVQTRLNRLAQLNGLDGNSGTLIVPIANIPLTERGSSGVAYGRAKYDFALTTPPQAQGPQDKAAKENREKRLAERGQILQAFKQAVKESSAGFYDTLVQDLTQCLDEFAKLDAALEKRGGPQAFPSSNIKKALEACLDVVRREAKEKLQAPADGGQPQANGEAPAAGGAATAPQAPLGVIRTRQDALRTLEQVAQYFRQTDPHSMLASALEQVVRWGNLPLEDFLAEVIPEDAPRRNLFQRVGIKEPPKSDKK